MTDDLREKLVETQLSVSLDTPYKKRSIKVAYHVSMGKTIREIERLMDLLFD